MGWRERTIVAAEDGLSVDALFDDELDVRVGASKGEEVCEEKGAGGEGGGPPVAALEHELADGREEGGSEGGGGHGGLGQVGIEAETEKGADGGSGGGRRPRTWPVCRSGSALAQWGSRSAGCWLCWKRSCVFFSCGSGLTLDRSDPLGLLDRVFPANAQAASLRILLARPQEPPVLYAAILNLRPRPSSRHIRPSDTADQQRAFCALALSLLGPDISPPSPEPRYALLQHLPSGDYWSSLTSDRPSSPSGALKNINTGLADLAAILPTPLSHPSATLAAYSPNNLPSTKPLPLHRSLQPASFLDYGPSTSFAPTFDHDGELVGPRDLRLLLSYKKSRFLSHPPDSIAPPNDPLPLSPCPLPFDIHSELDGLLSPHVIQNLNLVLDTVHLQNLIDELLTRTHRALVRLQALQVNRLLQHPPQISLDESSEEWQTGIPFLSFSLLPLVSMPPKQPTAF